MKLNDVEEMGYTNVNAGDAGNGVDSDIPAPAKEGREYQNLWSSEDDPRAIPPPAVICPAHGIACKKGICEDMAKILRDKKKAELRATWEKEKLKNRGKTFSLTNEPPTRLNSFSFFFARQEKEGKLGK